MAHSRPSISSLLASSFKSRPASAALVEGPDPIPLVVRRRGLETPHPGVSTPAPGALENPTIIPIHSLLGARRPGQRPHP